MSEIFLICSFPIKISKYLVLGIETLMIIRQMYHLFSIHSLRAFVPDSANEWKISVQCLTVDKVPLHTEVALNELETRQSKISQNHWQN